MMTLERRNPGIGVWFRADILNVLEGIETAHADIAGRLHGPEAELYRAGWRAAMAAMAHSFGLSYTPERPAQISQAAGQFGG